MRYPTLILALAGASFLTGCSSLISLNPFVTDAQATTDPRLVGTWTSPKADEKGTFMIEQNGSNYTIKYVDEKSGAYNFQGRITRSGDVEVLDIISTDDA